MNLNDPEVVREQYATEDGLEDRRSIYQDVEGEDAKEVSFRAIASLSAATGAGGRARAWRAERPHDG